MTPNVSMPEILFSPHKLNELEGRLAAQTKKAKEVNIVYSTMSSPIGDLFLAATEQGIIRVAFAYEDFEEALAELARKINGKISFSPEKMNGFTDEFNNYFQKKTAGISVPVDFSLVSGFRAKVLQVLYRVAYGTVITYKDLAIAAGSSAAMRAVGSACSHNPIPLVVPCHRVIRTDGGLGGFRGGLTVKEYLLKLEAAHSGQHV